MSINSDINPLWRFMEAKSVVVVGASKKKDSPGNIVAYNFVRSDFDGDVYFVNPRGGKLFSKSVYPSILDIPDYVDLAIIITPARFVPQSVRECAIKKIKRIVIASGGFSESGPEGEKLQSEVDKIARNNDIRIIGPNCVGILNPPMKLDTLFLPDSKVKRPKFGVMSFFSQSGAFGVSFLNEIAFIGYGRWISKFVSYGNASDVNERDILEHFGQDEATKVILGYIEGFKDPRGFLGIARKISKQKPIILMKSNRNQVGMQASASHTASIATTNDSMTDNLLRAAGILRVADWVELFNVAQAFATQPLPRGRNVLVITNAGGLSVMASDALGDNNLELAKLSPTTIEQLQKSLPSYAITNNPIDLTGSSTTEHFRMVLEIISTDEETDAILMITLPSAPGIIVEEFLSMMYELNGKKLLGGEKPFFFISMGGEEAETIKARLQRINIPTYSLPEHAAKVISEMCNYRENRE
ncbi:MAG: acetate--CoA ligase family protein [Candidatus Hodarchaeales archaeon]|jgi:acyl-CoA synthetase (NDP forming)